MWIGVFILFGRLILIPFLVYSFVYKYVVFYRYLMASKLELYNLALRASVSILPSGFEYPLSRDTFGVREGDSSVTYSSQQIASFGNSIVA